MQDIGDNVGALEMYNKALVICENMFGKEHPDTATVYSNIGRVIEAMGDKQCWSPWKYMDNKALALSAN